MERRITAPPEGQKDAIIRFFADLMTKNGIEDESSQKPVKLSEKSGAGAEITIGRDQAGTK